MALKAFFRIILLAAALLPPVWLKAAENNFNGVEIRLQPYVGAQGKNGYMAHGFLLKNTTGSAREVLVSIDNVNEGYQQSLEGITKALVIPPQTVVRTNLFQPPLNIPSSRVSLTVNGKYFNHDQVGIFPYDVKTPYYARWHGDDKRIFLVSQSIPQNANGTVFSSSGVASSPGYRAKGNKPQDILSFEWTPLPVEQWSDNWLSYSSYHGVIVAEADRARMPSAVADALKQYVASGGMLMVIGGTPPPGGFKSAEHANQLKLQVYGFGTVAHSAKETSRFTDDDWFELNAVSAPSAAINKFPGTISNDAMAGSFPVLDNMKVPFRQLFLIMLLFVVVIGPLNIFILMRKKKMIWILWTTPAIAVVFSLLVVFYSIFSEGWHSRVRINAVTLLDEGGQTAATLAIQGYYCPLPPGGLRFPDTAMVLPLKVDNGKNAGIDWSNGQRFNPGWVKSRIPAYFILRNVESRRERLKIVSQDAAATEVVNGLGATLENLQLVGPGGILYKASDVIRPGEKARLRASGKIPATSQAASSPRNIASGLMNHINNYPALVKMLRPGTYCATMKGTPFISPAIKPGELKEESLIYGIIPDAGGVK